MGLEINSTSLNKRMNADKTPEKDIFQDKVKLLDIWKDERRSRDISTGLMWENLKFFSLLISGLITANNSKNIIALTKDCAIE